MITPNNEDVIDNHSNERLHHYTSIEVLALILKNRTIRFNRLDNGIDDLEESDIVSGGTNWSKYTFVSCWTKSKEENIPLWKLYAQGYDGVRISFPKDFFEEYEITSADGINVVGNGIGKCFLPFSEVFGSTHIFIPPPIRDGIFFRPIEYVDDVKAKTETVAKREGNTREMALGEIGKYKHKRWAFQDEVRFVLTACPKPAHIDIKHPYLGGHLNHSMDNNIELGFSEYYLKIRESVFDEMEVTLCPSASESQYLIVEALLKTYAPNAQLRLSNLKNKVNLK